MKKTSITFMLLLIIILSIILSFATTQDNNKASAQTTNYFRLHIRANSNSSTDQSIKYKIKEDVVKFLSPLLADCESKAVAIKRMSKYLAQLEMISKSVLIKSGFNYGASASISKESFPTRVYEDEVLPAGEYDSLIITLGMGKGDNWWCVIYPPLCFTSPKSNVSITYKSKVYELVKKFFDL